MSGWAIQRTSVSWWHVVLLPSPYPTVPLFAAAPFAADTLPYTAFAELASAGSQRKSAGTVCSLEGLDRSRNLEVTSSSLSSHQGA